MTGFGYIALAALILLLLPAVVLPWEGRRVPDAVYAAIGAGGVLASGLLAGPGAALFAVIVGFASFALITGLVTTIRISQNLQILTGGHIKLLAAGSMWLGLAGTLAMLTMAFGGLILIGAVQRRRSAPGRPDFAAIAALAILCVGIQQTLPRAEATEARQGDVPGDR